MKKKTLAISVDENRYDQLTEFAEKAKMNRSTYINMLIDRADSVTAPMEILLLTEYFKQSAKLQINQEEKEQLDAPINKLIALLAGKES